MENSGKIIENKDIDNAAVPLPEEEAKVSEQPLVAKMEEKKPGIMSALFLFLLPYLINALITCVIVFGYDYFLAQKIVAVDIKGFISEQRDLYVTGKIDSEQFQKNVDRMSTIVSAINPNQIVLMGDAVVRNAKVIDVFEGAVKGKQ